MSLGLNKRVSCFMLFFTVMAFVGCGKSSTVGKVDRNEESKATVKVAMSDAVDGRKVKTTSASRSEENSKIGEIIGIEGVITIHDLASSDKKSIESIAIPIQIIWHRPNKTPTVVNGCHGHLTSLGDDKYRYQGEMKGPLKPGTYEMEVSYNNKKIASKKIVVTK